VGLAERIQDLNLTDAQEAKIADICKEYRPRISGGRQGSGGAWFKAGYHFARWSCAAKRCQLVGCSTSRTARVFTLLPAGLNHALTGAVKEEVEKIL
jgi:hypothetical protein